MQHYLRSSHLSQEERGLYKQRLESDPEKKDLKQVHSLSQLFHFL